MARLWVGQDVVVKALGGKYVGTLSDIASSSGYVVLEDAVQQEDAFGEINPNPVSIDEVIIPYVCSIDPAE
jgi:hypothetical protein